jgi:transposase
MLTRMTDEDWEIVVQVFRAVRSRRGDKGRDDRTFLEALHYFAVHNITWRALPAAFGNWNSIWMVDSQTTNSALSAMVS